MLASCATRSGPPLKAPAVDVAQPANPCPPALSVAVQAEPAVDGTIVKPVGPEETEATRVFLSSIAALISWGQAGWDRAAQAKAVCAVTP